MLIGWAWKAMEESELKEAVRTQQTAAELLELTVENQSLSKALQKVTLPTLNWISWLSVRHESDWRVQATEIVTEMQSGPLPQLFELACWSGT